jgi:hypothetical protein
VTIQLSFHFDYDRTDFQLTALADVAAWLLAVGATKTLNAGKRSQLLAVVTEDYHRLAFYHQARSGEDCIGSGQTVAELKRVFERPREFAQTEVHGRDGHSVGGGGGSLRGLDNALDEGKLVHLLHTVTEVPGNAKQPAQRAWRVRDGFHTMDMP